MSALTPVATAAAAARYRCKRTMFEWIEQNTRLLSLAVNAGMLIVWLFYAQLLFSNYRRSRRPRIIINQGIGSGLSAHCLISNMSQEPIFVECIVAALDTEAGTQIDSVTEYEHAGDDTKVPTLHDRTGQGPLKTGEYLDLGTFEEIAGRVMRNKSAGQRADAGSLQAIELYVVAIYGPDDSPVGARRRFELRRTDRGPRLAAVTVDSIPLTSREDRQRMRNWMEQYM